jgi:23S rRNA-/tRNA-specific pseudouridylate synthase
MEARPKTGRTHQIRVHFKHFGHPVICDKLYAHCLSKSEAIGNKQQSRGTKGRPCLLGFSRQALHAFSLSINLPSGVRHTFEAPFPADFAIAFTQLGIVSGGVDNSNKE